MSPTDSELLAQAHEIDDEISLDELAAARLIASERGDVGTTAEWCCIVDVELNRAKRANKTLYASLTRGAGFDPADADRAASHYRAWVADPAQHRPVARACDALTILERWSFGFPFQPGGCELDRARIGADNEPQAWVGPIAGVNAWRLMLFAPAAADARHLATYQDARSLITNAGRLVA